MLGVTVVMVPVENVNPLGLMLALQAVPLLSIRLVPVVFTPFTATIAPTTMPPSLAGLAKVQV